MGPVLFSDCDRRGRRPLGYGSLLSVFFPFCSLYPLCSIGVGLVVGLGCGCDFRLWVWFYFPIVIGVGIGLWVVGLFSLFYILVN